MIENNSTKTFKKDVVKLNERFIITNTLYESNIHNIYECYDIFLERFVAIKLLKNTLNSENNKKLLKAEFKMLVGINNPNIIRVYELYDEENIFFYTMDLLVNLFDVDYLSYYVDEIFNVFNLIHSKNIIHNDIKPNNFIFTKNGFVLIDFSLSFSGNENDIYSENQKLIRYLIMWLNQLLKINIIDNPKTAKKYLSEKSFNNIFDIFNRKRNYIN